MTAIDRMPREPFKSREDGPRTHDEPADATKSTAIDLADLKQRSVRGGLVTFSSQAVSTVVQLASTIILARMLTPADYGIIAMVTAITSFAGLFRDLGLSSAAIQKKNLTHGQQTNLFWVNVTLGTTLTLIVAMCSPLVSWFYAKPELTSVTIALSLNFLIGSFGTQHRATMVRNMRFGRDAVARISGGLISLVIAIVLANAGYSYWAIVASSLTGTLVSTVLLFVLSSFWPGMPGLRRGTRDLISFGAYITAFDLVNYFHRNLDNILIGRFWGSATLGIYSRAYALLMFPIHAIRGPINSVAFPAMSRLQDQPAMLRRYYMTTVNLLAHLTMPFVACLFISSDTVIEVTLGAQWHECAPIFSILALTAFIQPVAGLRGMLMTASGHAKTYTLWGIINAVCVSIGFIIGAYWGVLGVAASLAVVNYLLLYPSLRLAFAGTTISVRDFCDSIFRPTILSLLAGATTLYARLAVGLDTPVTVLGGSAVLFVAVYVAGFSATASGRSELRVFIDLVSQHFPRTSIKAPSA